MSFRFRRSIRRPIRGLAVAAAAGMLLVACGDDDDLAEPVVDPVDPVEDVADADLDPAHLDGLDVTVTGNVSEVVDGQAFRIDKDGLGEADEAAPDDDVALDFDDDYFDDDYDLYDYYEYDYDYYDYDYYTGFDTEYEDFDEEGVLVLTPAGTAVAADAAVQVNGTLRQFDELTLETVYDVDFDDELYGTYDSQYVIVADSVKTLPGTRDEASGTTGDGSAATSTTSGDSTSTTGES